MAEVEFAAPTARQALSLLQRTHTELAALDRVAAPASDRRAAVVALADELAVLARHPDCPVAVADLLHDWRDRLGSHVLVAEALADLEVHPDLADQMLQRGIDELLGEVRARLAAAGGSARATAHRPY